MLQQTEWNQLNTSSPVSQGVKSYASSPILFKRNLLLAEDTKHIQEKGTLNAKHRSLLFFYGEGHSFLPSKSLFELILEDLQEESSRFSPHNSTVSICLTEAGVALDVYQWLCCNSVKGQGGFSADHKELYDS